jgi:hypothetical protein
MSLFLDANNSKSCPNEKMNMSIVACNHKKNGCIFTRFLLMCPYSIQHSTQHWLGKTQFHPCGFSMEVINDLEFVVRCPLWIHHAPLPSTQVHQFPLKIHYESTKSSIWNPLIIHYTHIQVEMVHWIITNYWHGWAPFHLVYLGWKGHNVLGISFIVVLWSIATFVICTNNLHFVYFIECSSETCFFPEN